MSRRFRNYNHRRRRDDSSSDDGHSPFGWQPDEMLPEWGYPNNRSYPSGRNLPSRSRQQSNPQDTNFGYGGSSHLDYNSQEDTFHGQAPYPPVRQATISPGVQAPHVPSGQAPYASGGQAPYASGGQAPYGHGGQAPYGHGGQAPYGHGGQASYPSFGQARPVPSVAAFAFGLTGESHPKTKLICVNCDQDVATPYKGSYEPWSPHRHAHRDLAGYSYTTFHDSETVDEVVRVYSDGLGGPCSWHMGRTVLQDAFYHGHSEKSGHGRKRRSGH